jgi:hypothetical protein
MAKDKYDKIMKDKYKSTIKISITHLTKEQKKLIDKAFTKVWKDFKETLILMSHFDSDRNEASKSPK